jgi:hypothetical protein
MKRAAMIIIFLALIPARGLATDFWSHFAGDLSYNASAHMGIVAGENTTNRLATKDLKRLMASAFARSLPMRLGEVAYDTRFVMVPCMFTPQPEKCYFNVVLDRTFNEVRIVGAPGFSSKMAKRINRMYSRNVRMKESPAAKAARAGAINRWKPFNPHVGFDPQLGDVVMATPFYTYFGIYVEPRFSLRRQAGLTLLRKNIVFEVARDGAYFSYRFRKKPFGRSFYTVTYRPGQGVSIDNVLMQW